VATLSRSPPLTASPLNRNSRPHLRPPPLSTWRQVVQRSVRLAKEASEQPDAPSPAAPPKPSSKNGRVAPDASGRWELLVVSVKKAAGLADQSDKERRAFAGARTGVAGWCERLTSPASQLQH
jgi:hypothetical protein